MNDAHFYKIKSSMDLDTVAESAIKATYNHGTERMLTLN